MIKYVKNGSVEHSLKYGKIYSGLVDEFVLDKQEGKLVKTGTKDVDEIVQSCADCALDKIFEKYSALGVDLSSFVRPYTTPEDGQLHERKDIDLADIGESIAYFDEIKVKYGLDSNLTIDETIKYLEDNVLEFSNIINSKVKSKENSSTDIREEVKDDEKTNITKEI